MAWYEIKYACGHESREQIYGPVKNRQWIADRKAEGLCPDCYKAEIERRREEDNLKAAEAAREQDLPALTGTEKQITWAETIRQKMLGQLTKLLPEIRYEYKEIAVLAVERITAQTSASWWIDRRMCDAEDLVVAQIKAIEKENEAKRQQPTADTTADTATEATVRPENPNTETVAEIAILDDAVEVHFPEWREDFRKIIKEKRYKWINGRWRRGINDRIGTPQDRAAEIGNALLAAGFIIRIYDEQVRQAAIAGTFEPEHTRWITTKDGRFAILWNGRDDALYNAARKLPRSRWDGSCVVVPLEIFEEVMDFAQMYDFRLTAAALEAAEQARQQKEAALVANVEQAPKAKETPVSQGVPVLAVPQEVEIDAELRDDN